MFLKLFMYISFGALFASTSLAASTGFLKNEASRHKSHKSHEKREQSPEFLGFSLVDGFWGDVLFQDVEAYSRKLACDFIGITVSGLFNQCEQISNLKTLTIESFRIRNLIASRHNDTLVVGYDLDAVGNVVSGPNIDVWKNTECGWIQISHSYVPAQ